MKKNPCLVNTLKIFSVLIIFISMLSITQAYTPPYGQSEGVCYAQCAAWKFFWNSNYCWDVFEDNCVKDTKDTVKIAAEFIKELPKGAPGLKIIGQAYICHEMITQCLIPHLSYCRSTCEDPEYLFWFAPNLNAIGINHRVDLNALRYDKNTGTVYMRIVNDGEGYAEKIDVKVEAGSTDQRGGTINNWRVIYGTTIEELAPYDSTQNKLNVPRDWEDTVHWQMNDDEYNVIMITADPFGKIPELSEGDNTYKLIIDDLPEPARFNLELLDVMYNTNTVGQAFLTVWTRNTGEEEGIAKTSVFGPDDMLIESETESISSGEKSILALDIDMSVLPGHACGRQYKYLIRLEDQSSNIIDERYVTIKSYEGKIQGRVVDETGKGVPGIEVKTQYNDIATTDENGAYTFSGIRTTGTITITADDGARTASVDVTMTAETDSLSCNGKMDVQAKDILIMGRKAELTIRCPNYEVLDYSVSGTDTLTGQFDEYVKLSLAAGDYEIRLISRGDWMETYTTTLSPGENKTLNARCAPRQVMKDDDEITLGDFSKVWTIPIDGNIFAADITQDGNAVVMYTGNMGQDSTGKLIMVDMSGDVQWEEEMPGPVRQQNNGIVASYDGTSVLACILDKKDTIIRVYNIEGELKAESTLEKKTAPNCQMTRFGELIRAVRIFSPTLQEIELSSFSNDKNARVPTIADYANALAPNAALVTTTSLDPDCKKDTCLMTFNGETLRAYTGSGPADYAAFNADRTVTILSKSKTIRSYHDETKQWEKTLDENIQQVSISPGAGYIMALKNKRLRPITILDSDGEDITPEYTASGNFVVVKAADTGLYALAYANKQATLYVFGDPGEALERPEMQDSDLNNHSNGGDRPSKPGMVRRAIDWFKRIFRKN